MVLSGLVFGAAHLSDWASFWALLALVPFAMALAWLKDKTGSLAAPIVAHAVFNAVTVATVLVTH